MLTTLTMILEIAVGYATRSLALLSDGWHMATHVGALGLASVAYAVSRRYATHHAFVFGTGKVGTLAGYTSAIGLGLVALHMSAESGARLLRPEPVDFESSLPIAIVGLIVNLVSVLILHQHDERQNTGRHSPEAEPLGQFRAHADHCDRAHPPDKLSHAAPETKEPSGRHDRATHARSEAHPKRQSHRDAPTHHDHDHNHRAALLHVIADTFTSVLALVAIWFGRRAGSILLDSVSGLVGAAFILKWASDLARRTGAELLDMAPPTPHLQEVQDALETSTQTAVEGIRIWSLGGAERACTVMLAPEAAQRILSFPTELKRYRIKHLAIEVRDSAPGHDQPEPAPIQGP